jgi:hypothetical protein
MELTDKLSKNQMVGMIEIHQSQDNGLTYEKVHEQLNLFVEAGYTNILNLVSGIGGYEVGHWAVGDGSSIAAKTATIIDGEYERFAIDNQYIETVGGFTWLVNELNLASGEGNGTIRKVGLIGHGPTTTLANYNPLDPNESTHEWILSNYADILLPNGKIKDASIVLKFIWKWRLG